MGEDEDDSKGGSRPSMGQVPTGMTRVEVEHARRVAEDARRVMDSIDQGALDRIGQATEVSRVAHRALDTTSSSERYAGLVPSLGIPRPEGLLRSTAHAASIAERLASTHDMSALARLAMPSNVTADLLTSMRVWDQAVPESGALSEMIKQIGASTTNLLKAPGLANSPAIARIAESLGTSEQSSALANLAQATSLASAAAAGGGTALSVLVEESALYTTSLFENVGVSAAMERLAGQSTSGAFASLLSTPAYESLRTSLLDDSTFAGVHSLMEQTDFSSIASLAQGALGSVPLGALQQASARLGSVDPDLDEDEFEEAALRALREVDEDFDPDVPPTPEDMAATEALVRLLIALRPDLSEDPVLRKQANWLARGGGALLGVYLLVFHSPVFAALGTLVLILGFAKSAGDVEDRLLAPGAHGAGHEPEA